MAYGESRTDATVTVANSAIGKCLIASMASAEIEPIISVNVAILQHSCRNQFECLAASFAPPRLLGFQRIGLLCWHDEANHYPLPQCEGRDLMTLIDILSCAIEIYPSLPLASHGSIDPE